MILPIKCSAESPPTPSPLSFLQMECNYCWVTLAHTACEFQAGQEVRIDPQKVWESRVYGRKNCRKPKNRGKHNSRIIVSPDQQNWELFKRNLNCLLHVQNRVGNSAGYWKVAPSTSEAVFAPRIYFLIMFEIFRPAETWKEVKWFRSATPPSSIPFLAKQNPGLICSSGLAEWKSRMHVKEVRDKNICISQFCFQISEIRGRLSTHLPTTGPSVKCRSKRDV